MQRNPYNKELKEKLKAFKKLRENATGEEKELLDTLIDIILDILKSKPIKIRNYQDQILLDYNFLTLYRYLWPLVNDISKIANDDITSIPYPQLDVDNKELIGLVHDFFKNGTTKEIFELFCKLYKKRKSLYFLKSQDPTIYANSLYLPYDESFYVQMSRKNEFNDIAILTHEYGHGIHLLSNFSPNLYNNLIVYSEIVSMFFELICSDYYSKIKEFEKSAIVTQFETWDMATENAKSLFQEFSILSAIDINEFQSQGDLIKNIDSFVSSVNQSELSDLLDCRPSEDFIYIIAQSIVNELYMIYLDDPEKAFYLIKKIIDIDLNLPPQIYLSEINKLGINPNQNIDEYNMHLKRELRKIL